MIHQRVLKKLGHYYCFLKGKYYIILFLFAIFLSCTRSENQNFNPNSFVSKWIGDLKDGKRQCKLSNNGNKDKRDVILILDSLIKIRKLNIRKLKISNWEFDCLKVYDNNLIFITFFDFELNENIFYRVEINRLTNKKKVSKLNKLYFSPSNLGKNIKDLSYVEYSFDKESVNLIKKISYCP